MSEVPIQFVSDIDQLRQPGSVKFFGVCKCTHAGILYICPCGCGDLRSLTFIHGSPPSKGWKWDQNVEKPTLTPSILHRVGCGWHGFLRAGVWVDA